MRFAVAALISILIAPPVLAAEKVDRQVINRIIDEGMNRSQVMETAAWLTDRIGGRLTNSPAMREAERWTQAQYASWGLKNVHREGFEFGRGWSIEQSGARLTSPRVLSLRTIPVAWTPGTNGPVTAPIVVAPLSRERDFDRWKGRLAGRIVFVTRPDNGGEPTTAPFRRYTDEDLRKLDDFDQPKISETANARAIRQFKFYDKLDAFLAAEGAVAWVKMSRRDGGLLHGDTLTGFRVGRTPKVPGAEMAAEDYRRLARLAKAGAEPTLELNNAVRWHDDDTKAYNIIADIPGRDPKAGYVMAGAHLDSWVAGDGAVDNAAGSAVVMEAARILSTLGVKPKRTIRFALWAGEEQGLFGSMAYVEQHLASRPPRTGPDTGYDTDWTNRFPVTPRPGYGELGAYFNLDNGSGRIRGIYAENNLAAAPIFREWLAPFASMGASTVATGTTGGTDHVPVQGVGLPGYQFIQDPLDYGSRLHHTGIDTYDHLRGEDMRQNAVIMAAFLLLAAERDEPLPRMPLPVKPRETDPFAYPEDDE